MVILQNAFTSLIFFFVIFFSFSKLTFSNFTIFQKFEKSFLSLIKLPLISGIKVLVSSDKNLRLKLIGPLQSNKVKQSLNLFDVIETIDRERIATEIAKNLHKKTKTKSFYIQVNTGNEPQKSGIDPLQADTFINYCIKDLNLPIVGLMCIPPIIEEPSMHFLLLQKI